MQRSPIDRWLDRSGGGGKGAHNRETLPTTGRTTRIVIVPREFAPIPRAPAALPIPMAIRMRFLRHDGIYRSDVVQGQTKTGSEQESVRHPDFIGFPGVRTIGAD